MGDLKSRASTPESGSQSKPTIETVFKTDEEVLKILAKNGVSKIFQRARRDDIPEKTWSRVSGFLKEDSIFLHGSPGIGKTHIAAALMREKILGDNEAHYTYPDDSARVYMPSYPVMITIPDLLLECFNGGQEIESSIIERYSVKKCLILDDMGAEKTSEWSIQTLYSIIDRRYRDERQTLITSNLTLDEIAEKVGDRIASRIAGMCKVVEIKGKDRRIGG
jgi:DNA replication protein DnaC